MLDDARHADAAIIFAAAFDGFAAAERCRHYAAAAAVFRQFTMLRRLIFAMPLLLMPARHAAFSIHAAGAMPHADVAFTLIYCLMPCHVDTPLFAYFAAACRHVFTIA